MQEGAGPLFRNTPSSRDIGGAFGASLRACARRLAFEGRSDVPQGGARAEHHVGVHLQSSHQRLTCIPRPNALIRSRCTSLVPPPNVRISVPRYDRSTLPRRTASGDPRLTAPAGPMISSIIRYAWQKNSVPKTLVADASAGSIRPCVSDQADFQLISFRNSRLAWIRARCRRTHSWSTTRRPSASRVARAQAHTSSNSRCTPPGAHSATRSRLSWFVISDQDRKSTRLNSSHVEISYAVF